MPARGDARYDWSRSCLHAVWRWARLSNGKGSRVSKGHLHRHTWTLTPLRLRGMPTWNIQPFHRKGLDWVLAVQNWHLLADEQGNKQGGLPNMPSWHLLIWPWTATVLPLPPRHLHRRPRPSRMLPLPTRHLRHPQRRHQRDGRLCALPGWADDVQRRHAVHRELCAGQHSVHCRVSGGAEPHGARGVRGVSVGARVSRWRGCGVSSGHLQQRPGPV